MSAPAPQPPRGSSRADAWLPILLVATAVAGIVTVRFGPAPVPSSDPELAYYFRDTASALDDARDRWWVAVHALGAVTIVAAMAFVSQRPAGRVLAWAHRAAVAALVVIVLVAGTRTMPSDPWIQGLGWRLPVGLGVAATLWRWRARVDRIMQRTALRRIVLGLLVGWVCLSALQTPWNVVDTNHMLYTSDEVLAPAAGRWPFVDYLPQYSNLVGLPLAFVAPLVRIAPMHVAVIVSVALVMMTLWVFLRLLRSISTPTVQGIWIVAGAAAWPAFSNGFLEGGERAVGALNSGAMRPLLPLALGLGLGRLPQRAGSTTRVELGIGALAGMAAVNNVDFGVPALFAGAAAVTAAAWTQLIDGTREGAARTVARLVACYLAGAAAAVAITIAVFAVAGGGRPRPMLGALTALTYSRFGWFNVAMPVYGLHTLAGLLFLATAGLGVAALTVTPPAATRRAVAVRAAYFGLLGVLVLPYYAGRSLTPVLVIGYAFIIGVCAAHVLALTSNRLVWIVLVGTGLAAWSFVPQPLQSLERLTGPGRGETHDMVRVVDLDRRAAALRASVASLPPDRSAGLVASSGNSLALATGIPNAVLTSNAAFVLSGDYWAGLQCEHLAETGLDVVLVEDPAVAAALVGNAECADALDRTSARLLDTGWTAIDLRRGGS
jgi:hypothetical protein